jgi:cytochrome P450
LIDGDRAIAELNAMVTAEVEKRRAAPRPDFLSELVALVDGGKDELSLDELLSICQILLFAGQDTTVNSMCLGLLAFLRHPEQRKRFLSGEVHPITAMSELTRYTAMSNCMFKIAGEDMDVAG